MTKKILLAKKMPKSEIELIESEINDYETVDNAAVSTHIKS